MSNSRFCLISRFTDQFYLILLSVSHSIFSSNETEGYHVYIFPPSQAYFFHVLSEQKSHYLLFNEIFFKQSCMKDFM